MKPHLLKVPMEPNQSFSVRQDYQPFSNQWHYHPEVELLNFEKGSGTQFIGDSIMEFNPGDIVLIGANLPHCYRFANSTPSNGNEKKTDVKVTHFPEDILGKDFIELPENKPLKLLLEKSKRGIKVLGGNKEK